MNNQFLVKVKYTKQLESGTFKRVTEPYLVHAHTFTDAEARIYEELGSVIRGEFIVTSISRAEFHDIFSEETSDLWFKCKISYKSNDEEKSKTVVQNFLVSAKDIQEANILLKDNLSTMMVDYVVKSVIKTNIVDIFTF